MSDGAKKPRFVALPWWVVGEKDHPGPLRHIRSTSIKVLFAIFSHSKRDALPFPARETIADLCGVSVRAVDAAIRDLENHQVLTVETGGGRGNVNHYSLLFTAPPPSVKGEAGCTVSSPRKGEDSCIKGRNSARETAKSGARNGEASCAGTTGLTTGGTTGLTISPAEKREIRAGNGAGEGPKATEKAQDEPAASRLPSGVRSWFTQLFPDGRFPPNAVERISLAVAEYGEKAVAHGLKATAGQNGAVGDPLAYSLKCAANWHDPASEKKVRLRPDAFKAQVEPEGSSAGQGSEGQSLLAVAAAAPDSRPVRSQPVKDAWASQRRAIEQASDEELRDAFTRAEAGFPKFRRNAWTREARKGLRGFLLRNRGAGPLVAESLKLVAGVA
jgi:hypothetical protein